MDYRRIRSAEELIKLGYGESLPLEAKPSPDRSNASNIANMFSETMTVPLVNLKYKILGGDIEEIKSAFNELKTAWDSAMDSIHAISGNTYEYTADQAEYMLDNNDIMRIQDGEELIKASLRRKANPSDPVAWDRELRSLTAAIEERVDKGWKLIDIDENHQRTEDGYIPWARMRKPGFEGSWVWVSPAGEEDFRF